MSKNVKRISILFVTFLMFFLLHNIQAVYAETTIQVTENYSQSSAVEVFNIVNKERQANGQPVLVWDADLEKAAMQRVAEVEGYFSHTRPSGEDCYAVWNDIGKKDNYMAMGENIAYGYKTSSSVMEAWMNSTGHRNNILNSGYNCMAVAKCGDSWVQLFGYNITTINQTQSNFNGNKAIDIRVKDAFLDTNLGSINFDFGQTLNNLLNDLDNANDIIFVVGSNDISLQGLAYEINKDVINFSSSNKNILEISGKRVIAKSPGRVAITFVCGNLSVNVEAEVAVPDMTPYLFDSNYYANKYQDLKAVFGSDVNALKNHWETTGKAEGRQASSVFDPIYYLENNDDLKVAFGTDYVLAYNHFVSSGIAEYRKSSQEYWGEFYRINNSDLINFSNYQLIIHYVSCGRNEGRKANENAPVVNNPVSVPGNNNTNLDNIVFDYQYYADVNQDLKAVFGYDANALKTHWDTYGKVEGRNSSPAFDVKYYVENNSDLKVVFGNNYAGAVEHFISHGISEGRRTSRIFDVKYYLNNNSDLKAVYGENYKAIFEHFVICGVNEPRVSANDFSVPGYRGNNADLSNAFGESWKSYFVHYMNFGITEGRICV